MFTHLYLTPKVTIPTDKPTYDATIQQRQVYNKQEFVIPLLILSYLALTLSAMHGELICEIHIPCLGIRFQESRLVRSESDELSFQDS